MAHTWFHQTQAISVHNIHRFTQHSTRNNGGGGGGGPNRPWALGTLIYEAVKLE